jgi:methionyl-tRNA formyltransferase
MAAIEWTIKEHDPIAGGSIYHLAPRMDAGAIAAQEWCFVKKGETARELWERALAPIGLKLMRQVIRYAQQHDSVPSTPQDEQFATLAPQIEESVSSR